MRAKNDALTSAKNDEMLRALSRVFYDHDYARKRRER